MKQWRQELRILLDRFHRDLEFRTDVTVNLETLFNDKTMISANLSRLENEVEQLKAKKNKIKTLSNSQTNLNHIVPMNQLPCERCAILEPKLAVAIVDLRQMKNIVCETEDKFDKVEKLSTNVRKLCATTAQDLVDFKEHLRLEKKMRSFVNAEGHLLWRITDYAAKLKNAQTNNIPLKSPIFCDQQYGYSLRVR